jgi:hypothetical protein
VPGVAVRVNDLAHGLAQSIRVIVNVGNGDGLGAHMAAAQGVLLVAFDGDDLISLGLYHQATHRLAQVANPMMAHWGFDGLIHAISLIGRPKAPV